MHGRRPQHAELVDQAFTHQAASFNASAVANASELLDRILDRAKPQPTERWLEAACGPGIISRRLAAAAGSVHGIDATEAMIDTARREAEAERVANVSFELGDATATSLPTASFDGAVTRFSVHHIPVPARLMEELARLVRPGGKILVLDHLADEDAESRSWALEIERLRDPSHWASLSASHLPQLGRDEGLSLTHDERFTFELDFDDWLRRAVDSPPVQEMVEAAISARPEGTECFRLTNRDATRVLTLTMWLGLWRR